MGKYWNDANLRGEVRWSCLIAVGANSPNGKQNLPQEHIALHPHILDLLVAHTS